MYYKNFTLPHIFQVDFTELQVYFILVVAQPNLYAQSTWSLYDSKWSPDEPSGVSGLHLESVYLDFIWTLSDIFILIVLYYI